MRRLGAILGLALTLSVALPERAAADSVARTWELGPEPFGMVVDPTDGRVYVANSRYVPGSGSISVVDPSNATGDVTSLATSGAPGMLALDPVHRRLYSSNQDRTLQVFDLTTMRLEATLPVGGLGVAVDPLTRRVYVIDYAPGSGTQIVEVDGSANVIVQSVQAPANEVWWGLALDPGVHRIYVTNMNNSTLTAGPSLLALDDRDLTIVDNIPVPVIPRFAIAVDETQHRVYLAGADRSSTPNWPNSMFYALDGSGSNLAMIGSTSVPGYPSGMAVAPDGQRVFLTDTCECGWGYRELDARTFEVLRFNATPSPPFFAAFHPDGRLYVDAWGPSFTSNGHLAAVSLGNTPPSITQITFAPPVPTTTDILRGYDDGFDVDLPSSRTSTNLTRSYEWSRNGVSIASEAGPELDLARAESGDRGDTITLRVTVTDRDGSSATASGSVVIANAAPSVLVSLDNTAPRTNDVLRATTSASDADGDPVAFAYQWSRNGAPIAGATAATFDLAASGDRGDVIAVRATATDGHGGVAEATASATVANTPPSAPTLVLSTTSPTTNETLRATASSADADGDSLTYGFAYYVNGMLVWYSGYGSGTISFDLGLPNWGDRGDSILVLALASDGPALSSATTAAAVVANAAPVVQVSLNQATASTNDVLVATAVGQDADGDALTYSYTWRVRGVVKRTVTTTSTTDSFDLSARGIPNGAEVTVEVRASDGAATSNLASASVKLRGNKL